MIPDDSFRFSVNESTEDDIRPHLFYCDGQFTPRLSERVDLSEYSRKIRAKAFTFEAWKSRTLVGLVAAYFNIPDSFCYITNVSVFADYGGRGIANRLLVACFDKAKADGVKTVSLEVSKDSHPAIRLYEKFGFQVVEHRGAFIFMQCLLNVS